MNKYDLPLREKQITVQEQIDECRRILYRNYLENLTFTANNEKAKMKEVEYNTGTLKEKLDLLWKEHDRLSSETSSNSPE